MAQLPKIVGRISSVYLFCQLKRIINKKPDTKDATRDHFSDKQVLLCDPDAHSTAMRGKDTGRVGNNVKATVGTTHHLIVAHEVTNVGTRYREVVRFKACFLAG